MLDKDSQVAGRITFTGITYGACQSCNSGHWITQERNGRGYATDAVQAMTACSVEELGLHSVQVETLMPTCALNGCWNAWVTCGMTRHLNT